MITIPKAMRRPAEAERDELEEKAAAADVARELLKSMAAGAMTPATIRAGLSQIVEILEGEGQNHETENT